MESAQRWTREAAQAYCRTHQISTNHFGELCHLHPSVISRFFAGASLRASNLAKLVRFLERAGLVTNGHAKGGRNATPSATVAGQGTTQGQSGKRRAS